MAAEVQGDTPSRAIELTVAGFGVVLWTAVGASLLWAPGPGWMSVMVAAHLALAGVGAWAGARRAGVRFTATAHDVRLGRFAFRLRRSVRVAPHSEDAVIALDALEVCTLEDGLFHVKGGEVDARFWIAQRDREALAAALERARAVWLRSRRASAERPEAQDALGALRSKARA